MSRVEEEDSEHPSRGGTLWWFWWAIWAGALMITVRGEGTLFGMSHTARERQSRDWAQVKALVTEVMGPQSVA